MYQAKLASLSHCSYSEIWRDWAWRWLRGGTKPREDPPGSLYKSYNVICWMPNLMFPVVVHGAAFSFTFILCKQVKALCAGRGLARSLAFSCAHFGQFAVNVAPSTPTVFAASFVPDDEIPAPTTKTVAFIDPTVFATWGSIPPHLLQDHMAKEAIARLDLAKYDVIHCHV